MTYPSPAYAWHAHLRPCLTAPVAVLVGAPWYFARRAQLRQMKATPRIMAVLGLVAAAVTSACIAGALLFLGESTSGAFEE